MKLIYSIVAKDRTELTIDTIIDFVKNIDESDLLIYDDGSRDALLLSYYIGLIRISRKVHIFLSGENKGVEFANINRLEYFNLNNDYYVYLTDNDVELSSSHFQFVIKNTYNLLNSTPDIFAATLFNVTPNGCHDIIGECFKFGNYNYIQKRSFGGVSVLIKISDFKKAMEYYQSKDYNGNFGWDWALCHYGTKVLGKRLVATYESYVQHKGSVGVNSKVDKFDFATNFVN